MSTKNSNLKKLERKWLILDATGQSLGRVAAKAASILRGKHKVSFAPHVDCGDHVIVLNCNKMVLTGKKKEQKFHYWHTGWPGGIKSIKYGDLLEKDPSKVMILAVNGMLPKNSLGRKMSKRLRVYNNDKHNHFAQQPEIFSL